MGCGQNPFRITPSRRDGTSEAKCEEAHPHRALLATRPITPQVYNAFDLDGDGQVAWRHMLFMLRVATNAQVCYAKIKNLVTNSGMHDILFSCSPLGLDCIVFPRFSSCRVQVQIRITYIYENDPLY